MEYAATVRPLVTESCVTLRTLNSVIIRQSCDKMYHRPCESYNCIDIASMCIDTRPIEINTFSIYVVNVYRHFVSDKIDLPSLCKSALVLHRDKFPIEEIISIDVEGGVEGVRIRRLRFRLFSLVEIPWKRSRHANEGKQAWRTIK